MAAGVKTKPVQQKGGAKAKGGSQAKAGRARQAKGKGGKAAAKGKGKGKAAQAKPKAQPKPELKLTAAEVNAYLSEYATDDAKKAIEKELPFVANGKVYIRAKHMARVLPGGHKPPTVTKALQGVATWKNIPYQVPHPSGEKGKTTSQSRFVTEATPALTKGVKERPTRRRADKAEEQEAAA
jgi:hypothetical protein